MKLWRRLEKDEIIQHGDLIVVNDYDLNADEATLEAYHTENADLPTIELAFGWVGSTVRDHDGSSDNSTVWRLIASETPKVEQHNGERKIDLNL